MSSGHRCTIGEARTYASMILIEEETYLSEKEPEVMKLVGLKPEPLIDALLDKLPPVLLDMYCEAVGAAETEQFLSFEEEAQAETAAEEEEARREEAEEKLESKMKAGWKEEEKAKAGPLYGALGIGYADPYDDGSYEENMKLTEEKEAKLEAMQSEIEAISKQMPRSQARKKAMDDLETSPRETLRPASNPGAQARSPLSPVSPRSRAINEERNKLQMALKHHESIDTPQYLLKTRPLPPSPSQKLEMALDALHVEQDKKRLVKTGGIDRPVPGNRPLPRSPLPNRAVQMPQSAKLARALQHHEEVTGSTSHTFDF